MEHPTRITITEDAEISLSPSPSTPSNTNTNTPSSYFPSRCSCFTFPCIPRPHSLSSHPYHTHSSDPSIWRRVWSRPIKAFQKLREWSEIVAGPKWKTFIRRFNHPRHKMSSANSNNNNHGGKFQYDPLSYALNFDEGHGQNSQYGGDSEGYYDQQFPDFSSRYATLPLSSRSSMDLGKGAPAG